MAMDRGRVRRHNPVAYGIALVFCVIAIGALVPLAPSLRVRFAPLAFFPAIALAAWRGGFGPGVFATAVAASILAWVQLLAGELRRSTEPSHVIALSLFVFGGLVLSAAAGALYGQRRREHDARLEAERRRRYAERLQDIVTALSRARTPAEVVDECVLEATHSLGAAAGGMAVIEPDGQWGQVARSVGFRQELADGWRRFPLNLRTPFSDAIRASSSIVLHSREVRRERYPHLIDGDLFNDQEAIIAVPLVARGQAIAVLVLALAEPHDWSTDERDFLHQVARRAVQALERARTYELAESARAEAEDLRARADQELAERQKAEEALRDSEARYRALAARTSRLHALTSALSEAVTLDAVARAVIRQGCVVVGAQSGSVTLLVDEGRNFVTLYAESGSNEVPEAWQRFAVEPGLYSTEAVERREPVFVGSFAEWQRRYWRSAAQAADGGFASVAALPLIAEGNVIGVLAFHFTAPLNFDEDYRVLLSSVAQHCAQALDRARLYEAEQRARTEAEAANRSKDDFLSTVSHELRTPLNAILGWTSMLRGGSLDVERSARALQAIYGNAMRQAQLVDELLDVSRIAAGRAMLDLREVELAQVIRGAVESMLPLAEAKGLEVHFGDQPSVAVIADARRLEQVFLNLISNAVKFTPSGGRIDVGLTVADPTVDVRVSDTGIGMDPAFVPHAFDRFRQADSHTTRTYGGLGLGLSIAKHLVDAHGGAIRIESDGPGRGTTCIVTLPVAARASAGAGRAGKSASAAKPLASRGLPDLTGVHALVVDDEPDAREMMAAALEGCGATVVSASSSPEALTLLGRMPVDVLLADIGMPEEDGYTLIRKVRALPSRNASVPAAAVTAYVREDQRQRALAAGFQLHLAKPIDPRRLAHEVASLIRVRNHVSPEPARGGG